MTARAGVWILVLVVGVPWGAFGQDVRSHTRMAPRGTTMSEAQAVDLTLTVTEAATRPVQTWVRTAGLIDSRIRQTSANATDPVAVVSTLILMKRPHRAARRREAVMIGILSDAGGEDWKQVPAVAATFAVGGPPTGAIDG